MTDIEYIIDRLEEALEIQRTRGEIGSTPIVGYCFECDEIAVGDWAPEGCLGHSTVSADGYEHAGIGDVLTALRFMNTGEDEVPEYIIRAEYEFWDWGTSNPLDCVDQFEEKSPREKLKMLDEEIQYHLGAYTAAQFVCNSLYKIEGFDDRYYPEYGPPWIEEAVGYAEDLEKEVEERQESAEEEYIEALEGMLRDVEEINEMVDRLTSDR